MKALIGSWENHPQKLVAEITALRSKVAELKAEIADLQAENALLRERDADAAQEPELASTSA